MQYLFCPTKIAEGASVWAQRSCFETWATISELLSENFLAVIVDSVAAVFFRILTWDNHESIHLVINSNFKIL